MPVNIRPATVDQFISDTKIILPRFQRKLTWAPEKNFKLALSLFKAYPLGVVVLRTERIDEKKSTEFQKLLLDGRQRFNALSHMRNLEQIYSWAKGPLEIKHSDSEIDIADRYWAFIDDYFGEEDVQIAEPETETMSPSPEEEEPVTEEPEEMPEPMKAGAGAAQVSEPGRPKGLIDLLELVLVVHPKRGNRSEFTKAFDFRRETESPYIKKDPETRKDTVDAVSLIEWIEFQKRLSAARRKSFPPSEDEFYGWLTEGAQVKTSEARLRTLINQRWAVIDRILHAIDALHTRLSESYIGSIR